MRTRRTSGSRPAMPPLLTSPSTPTYPHPRHHRIDFLEQLLRRSPTPPFPASAAAPSSACLEQTGHRRSRQRTAPPATRNCRSGQPPAVSGDRRLQKGAEKARAPASSRSLVPHCLRFIRTRASASVTSSAPTSMPFQLRSISSAANGERALVSVKEQSARSAPPRPPPPPARRRHRICMAPPRPSVVAPPRKRPPLCWS